MNLSLKKEDVQKVLRELLRDNIVPRLTNLEERVRLLRKVTWPVCQGIKEKSQLSDIASKKEFLSNLDPAEGMLLLKLKSKGLLTEELALLIQSERR